MHLAQVSLLLLPLVAGCAFFAPAVPIESPPEVVAQQRPTGLLPGAGAGAAVTATPKPPSTVTRAPAAPTAAATEAKRAPRPVAAVPVPVPVPAPATAPNLDLNGLKEQLKETKAIGVFTKISLKNQVDDLLQQFRDHYQGKAKITMAQLRRSYDLLLMKVLSLVQDADQRLASAIVASREGIWSLLADRQKFSTLQV